MIFLKHNFFFFLRKISPELTPVANPPLFAEEDWPRANICVHLPLLYMWDAYHSTGGAISAPGIQTGKPQVAKAELMHLTTAPPGQLPWSITLMKITSIARDLFMSAILWYYSRCLICIISCNPDHNPTRQENPDSRARLHGSQNPAQLLFSCVTFNKLLNFSVPQFLHV